MLYAVGQGALAVECRVNDEFVLKILSKLCDFKTQCQILTERSFLKTLGGGCSAPVGINSIVTEKQSSSTKSDFNVKVKGGVWSLNGKDEVLADDGIDFVLDVVSEISDTEDDDYGASPSKRQKLTEEESEKLKRSPEVIDESSCSVKDINSASEIVNIHGKVFDACPYSGKFKTDQNVGSNPQQSSLPTEVKFDLRSMPIGMDVMGECPVLNIKEKVDFKSSDCGGSGDGLSCPVVGHSKPANFTDDEIKKCPFLSKQTDTAVQMFDYEEDNKNKQKAEPKSLICDLDDVKLYCGIFCHDKNVKSIFDQCEDLGVSLAQKLIAAGALDIMKKAQDEIHSKC